VTSVTVNDAFSDDYDNYKIIMSGGVGTAPFTLACQLGSTTSGYYSNLLYGAYNASTPLSAATSGGSNFPYVGGGNSNAASASFELQGPHLGTRAGIIAQIARIGITSWGGVTNGFITSSEIYTSFTLIPDTAALTGGTIRVYGYRKG
jgi:hypothetical protein